MIHETRGSFVNCTFERNSAESRLQRYHSGGAVSATTNSHLTVHHCLFKENTATYIGGAIFMRETQGSFVNCTFERNSVESRLQRYHYGRAVSTTTNSHLTVHHCLFKENTATYIGGAIFMHETRGSFVNCTFERNSGESRSQRYHYCGAVSAATNSHLTVHHCLFKENTANYSGGAISMQETRGSFINCIFKRNSVESPLPRDDYGGAVSTTTNSHLTVHHCLFKENTANYSGGANSMQETRGSFVNCTFERNSVESRLPRDDYGGAVCAIANSHLTAHHCLFKENRANHSGGATYIQESQIDIKQCLFKKNTAKYSGGAISMKEIRGTFVNCTFVDNAVQKLQGITFGGAIAFTTGGFSRMTQCFFKKNTATFYGGACYSEMSEGSFENCTFEGKV